MLKKFTNKKGFTLMEMLIVVAIIAILVAIAIPTFSGALTKSKEAADVANIRAAYAEYQIKAISGETPTWNKPEGLYFEVAAGASGTSGHGYSYDTSSKTITYEATKLTNETGGHTYTWVLGDSLT